MTHASNPTARQNFDNSIGITFKKSGSSIQSSINRRMSTMEGTDLPKLQRDLETLCKARGLDTGTVLASAEWYDLGAVSQGANSARYSGGVDARPQVPELQVDVDRMHRLAYDIAFTKRSIESLKRVAGNVEVSASYDLSWNELVAFGF